MVVRYIFKRMGKQGEIWGMQGAANGWLGAFEWYVRRADLAGKSGGQ